MANGLASGIQSGVGLGQTFQAGRQRRREEGLTAQKQQLPLLIEGARRANILQDPQAKLGLLNTMRGNFERAGLSTAILDQGIQQLQSGSPEDLAAFERSTEQLLSLGGEQFTLSPGQTRFQGGQAIAAVPERESGESLQKQTNKLRQTLNNNLADTRKVNASFKRVQAATKSPSAAGDLALIFNFMKMLDPGSVVRESEFATAENAAGVPDRIKNVWNKLKSGEKLGVNQRADFIQQAENLFTSQEESGDVLIGNILQQADQDEISRVKVIGKERLKEFESRAAARQQAPIFSGSLKREVTEQDITDTISANPGLTREQLLEQLQVQ